MSAGRPKLTQEQIAATTARRKERDRIRGRKRVEAKYAAMGQEAPKVRASPTKKEAKKPKPIIFAKPKPAKNDTRSVFKNQEAYTPPNVKRTVWPTPPDRFHVEPPAVGFASLGIGRYEI